jgi:hypothetical protein
MVTTWLVIVVPFDYFPSRNGHEWCGKCSYTFSRGDIPCWDSITSDFYWENNKWNKNKIISKTNNYGLGGL